MPRPPDGHEWVVLDWEKKTNVYGQIKPKWRQCRRCGQKWYRNSDHLIKILKCDEGVVVYIHNS